MIVKLILVVDSSGLEHLVNPAAISEIILAPQSKKNELATVVMNYGAKFQVEESEKTFIGLLKVCDVPAIHGDKQI
jgi:hypothetical protein